ncbi:hypothetical protein LAT59_00905 [Candidatus Gracilibacteria bacterium]|nr:hypothetical protein [Candidatus Gracilibacteria bacterium]
MDFELRRKIIFERLETHGELDCSCEDIIDECRREIICLLEEMDELESIAYGIDNSELITSIYYYNRMLERIIGEMREFIRGVDILTAEQALYILRRK